MIYLDSAATSFLKPRAVADAMERAVRSMASPARGSYPAAMDAAELVYACREAAGELFHTEPEQVVFTMNATHALNLAIHSIIRPGMRVVISGYEHNAVLRPLIALGAELVIVRTPLFDQRAALEGFLEELDHCDAVVCTHVSNVFGFILPIEELSAACKRQGVPLIVDAAQSAGFLPVDMALWDCAFIAMPGHKGLMGPQGTGILLCNGKTRPLLYGGTGSDSRNPYMPDTLPERLEAGTMNVPGIAGLLEGLRYVNLVGTGTIEARERELADLFADALSASPVRLFRSSRADAQCGVLSLIPEKMDCERAGELLSRAGIAVRTGLHCAPLAHETASTSVSGTVRISFSPLLSVSEVKKASMTTKKILEK